MNHPQPALTPERKDKIQNSVRLLLGQIPADVTLVAAAKSRSIDEVQAAISAGIGHVGQNYIQDAQAVIPALRTQAKWHMIGHLQRNKINKAIQYFDMIESVDSQKLAQSLNTRCENNGIRMPVLVEVNTGREQAKSGISPDDALTIIRDLAKLPFLQVRGIMTMGPFSGDPENARPYFQLARRLFEQAQRESIPGIELTYLSMGMSNSYRVAIDEGANLIRIGTAIFGPRS